MLWKMSQQLRSHIITKKTVWDFNFIDHSQLVIEKLVDFMNDFER